MKLPASFYTGRPVTAIARSLLGKLLVTSGIDGVVQAGWIVEAEAYSHRERGCHAFGNKMTARNQAMFLPGGHAYVYLCYGMHWMFNVVTGPEGKGDAVLIRAIQPLPNGKRLPPRVTAGPGKLTKALQIDRSYNGLWLGGDRIWLEEGMSLRKAQVVQTTRIGIEYAGPDALLPWRFYMKDNPWVSRK
ncbi:MAG: DNA-3-methyladenine glycosylase [Bacteroidota bacterium]